MNLPADMACISDLPLEVLECIFWYAEILYEPSNNFDIFNNIVRAKRLLKDVANEVHFNLVWHAVLARSSAKQIAEVEVLVDIARTSGNGISGRCSSMSSVTCIGKGSKRMILSERHH